MKRLLQKEGVFKDIKDKRFYEKPSVKKKRKQVEAMRKRAKALRTRQPRQR
jgi:small subunit ribosomal protein S21